LAQASGLRKSALHRHWTNCVNRRRLAELKQRRSPSLSEGRAFVQWPDQPCPALGPDDWLVVVTFEKTALDKVGNPRALLHRALVEEAEREHLQQFPSAVIASDVSETNTATNGISECVAADDTSSDSPPCEVGEQLLLATTSANQGALGTLKSECEHDWRNVAASVIRCQRCGAQQDQPVVLGINSPSILGKSAVNHCHQSNGKHATSED
jgi:hypothetical protein